MRGIPKNPVICVGCNDVSACPADQLCHSCRLERRAPVNKRFHWNEELDNRLRQAYQRAYTRAELTTNLDLLQRSCGFTRVVILNRAITLGLGFGQRRAWTGDEIDVVRECAGKIRPSALAKRLNRTHASVTAKLKQLAVSARITEGYTKEDLRLLLGVSSRSINNWIAWGWLRVVTGRIPETSVAKFLRQHPDQYQLSRVEEAWFKGLMFPAFNHLSPRERKVRNSVIIPNEPFTIQADKGISSDGYCGRP